MQAIMGSQAQMATSVLRMLLPGSTGMEVQWLLTKMLPSDAVTAPFTQIKMNAVIVVLPSW